MATSRIAWIPPAELADVRVMRGPTMVKSEQGLLTTYVFINFSGRDVGGYVSEAKEKAASVKIPPGYRLEWSGEYDYLLKTEESLKVVIPFTLFIIFVLIYLNTQSVAKTSSYCWQCRFPWWARSGCYLLELQPEHRRMGGHHRTRRAGCRDRRGHASLPGSRL